MRKAIGCLLAMFMLLGVAESATAQSKWVRQDCNIICSPVVLTQNMAQLFNGVAAPTLGEIAARQPGEAGFDTEVDNDWTATARVTAAMPTQFKPFILFFDVQWTPFEDNVAGFRDDGSRIEAPGKANQPAFVFGPIFRIIGGSDGAGLLNFARNPYYTLDLDPLFVYAPPLDESPSAYNAHFTPEADQYLHIGKLVDPNNNAPFIHNTSIHFFIDYFAAPFDNESNITDPDEDPFAAPISRWVFSVGLTTPLAALP